MQVNELDEVNADVENILLYVEVVQMHVLILQLFCYKCCACFMYEIINVSQLDTDQKATT